MGAHSWRAASRAAPLVNVQLVPFSALEQWHFDPATGNLHHSSGRFFSIVGLRAVRGVPPGDGWAQPIIDQPETGILGFLYRGRDPVELLVQAKFEPGNLNPIQLAPTVQATQSNYTRRHEGHAPHLVEEFISPRSAPIIDQSQSEQGSTFLRKRNRNMLVEAGADSRAGVHDDHEWLSLPTLLELLREPDTVNMNARSLVACFPSSMLGATPALDDFSRAVRMSLSATDAMAERSLESLVAWLEDLRRSPVDSRVIPLREVEGWTITPDAIRHREGRAFDVIAVNVAAEGREVTHWGQPLIRPATRGFNAWLCQRRHEVLHCLVQARTEIGGARPVELAPSVQCFPEDWAPQGPPAYFDLAANAASAGVRFDGLLSEEGGRFYHAVNRYCVIELDEAAPIDALPGYFWLTVAQLKHFIDAGEVNIEARSAFACLLAARLGA